MSFVYHFHCTAVQGIYPNFLIITFFRFANHSENLFVKIVKSHLDPNVAFRWGADVSEQQLRSAVPVCISSILSERSSTFFLLFGSRGMSDSSSPLFVFPGILRNIFSFGSIQRVSSHLSTTTLSLDIGRVLKPGNSWREGVEERDWCFEAQHEGGRERKMLRHHLSGTWWWWWHLYTYICMYSICIHCILHRLQYFETEFM